MAKLLLNKLLEVKPLSRYTVDKALKHPWITRNVNDKIPMMYNEVLKKQNLLDKFKDIVIKNFIDSFILTSTDILTGERNSRLMKSIH